MKSFKEYIIESDPFLPSYKSARRINSILKALKKKYDMEHLSNDAFVSHHISSGNINTDSSDLNRSLIRASSKKVRRNLDLRRKGVKDGDRILIRAVVKNTPNTIKRDRRVNDQETDRITRMRNQGYPDEYIQDRIRTGSLTHDLRGHNLN